MLQLIAGVLLLCASGAAHAHHVAADAGNTDLALASVIVASLLLYALGIARLWKRAGPGRGIRFGQAARFGLGWVALAAALLSPIDALSGDSFAVHMIQHELLMVVAAPLLVLGRPLEAWASALPKTVNHAFAGVARFGPLRWLWRWITEPVGAWCLHALCLWVWHLPLLFDAALADTRVHIAQHASFFGSALAFWWAVFGRGARLPNALSMASLVTTMLHTGALGALLTFAPTAWYAHYAQGAFGLSALEDQQLGGLVMWLPGSLSYLVAALVIAARWLRDPREPSRPPSRIGDSRAPP
ncbi:MAG: cytochrome c oxidase assembly protein [Bacillota bacterium]